MRSARVRAVAKVNLCLEVLDKRPDNFHNLRTIFHTISLADTLELGWVPGRNPATVSLRSALDIPNNLVVRATEAVLRETKAKGRLTINLIKKIPMGGGLGGGSADAAAVLLALPALVGKDIPPERLHELAVSLGSDVPFFLLGGACLGLGRGTELYPLADFSSGPALIVAPDVHVSTPDAYRALNRQPAALTQAAESLTMSISQSLALRLGAGLVSEEWSEFCRNDFEPVVFAAHPQLKAIRNKLLKAGARPAMMTGSGAAVFGVFRDRAHLEQSLPLFTKEKVFPVSLMGRRRYREMWWRQLGGHVERGTWPLRSRHAR